MSNEPVTQFQRPAAAAGGLKVPTATMGTALAPPIANAAEPTDLSTDSTTLPQKEDLTAYKAFLEEKGISEEVLYKALDSLLTNGVVYWECDILGKIDVRFKTRPAWVNTHLLKQLEVLAPSTYVRFTNIVNLYNLAGSLTDYSGRHFTPDNEEGLETGYAFVSSLPLVLQSKLIEQLAIFDRVMAIATSDWALENFMQPQSDV